MNHRLGADWSGFGRFYFSSGLFDCGVAPLLHHELLLVVVIVATNGAGCGNIFTIVLTALEQPRVADIHEQDDDRGEVTPREHGTQSQN